MGMTELEKNICEALNTFCFLNIWNEPVSEYRVNIQPIMMDDRSKSGAVSINGNIVELPRTDEPFYLFSISTDCFRNAFWLPTLKWVSGVHMCNDYDVLMHVYTEQGYMLSHGDCYLTLTPGKNAYVLAVTKAAMLKLTTHEKAKNIYVTIYKDSDIANDTTLYSYHIPTNDRNGAYRLAITRQISEINDNNRIIAYVNGYETDLVSAMSLEYGDYVDLVYDRNIIFSYNIDFTDLSKYWTYYSEMDKLEKVIVHTPRELNMDNKVLTHNTCDFFIRRKNPLDLQAEGLYVHRTATRSISQITHQDFSLPVFIVDAYRDYLDTQAVTLKVIVRQHDKDNHLLRDKNYIDMLYTQLDDTIIDCLRGAIPSAPNFWRAEVLEASTYVKMMFDIPDVITEENMYEYVEGLGYYHTISLLCERVTTSKVTDLFGNFISFNKPYLFKDRPIYPIAYCNGTKIHADKIAVANNLDTGFAISFLSPDDIKRGDSISVEMFLDGIRTIFEFSPSEEEQSITIPYNEFVLYEVIDNSPAAINTANGKTSLSYKKIETLTGVCTVQTNATTKATTLVFSLKYIGRKYIIQNKYCVRPLLIQDIFTEKLISGDNLIFDLVAVTAQGNMVPILEPKSTQVFINGKYLINGVDYHIVEIREFGKNISMCQCVIQNKSYLVGNGNDTFELIVTSAEIEDTSHGFVKNNQILHQNNKVLSLWFDNISTSHIEGRLELGLINQSTHIEVPAKKYRQGAPYELSTNVPRIIKDFVLKFHDNDDTERMIVLNEYFYGVRHNISGTIVLPYSHNIYSIFMNRIIYDIINKKVKIAYDPDIPRLKKQVEEYNYLKQYDLVFNDNGELDLTYLDLFPTYKEWGGVDLETRQLIHALVKLCMPQDDFSSGEIVNVN